MQNELICRECGSELRYYDKVPRIIRSKNRETKWVKIDRFRCHSCGKIRRFLPDFILPRKQYESEIIFGVVEGLITCSTIGYEDYPCEMTMQRWKQEWSHKQ